MTLEGHSRFFSRLVRQATLATLLLVFAAAVVGAQSGVSPALQPQSPFSGSVRTGEATDGPLPLSLTDAVARGLKSNLGVILSRETIRSAQGQREQGISALLPHLAFATGVNLQQLNVRAQEGIQFPGVPSVIGPFTNFDTRVRFTQSVFDMSSVLGARADGKTVESAEYGFRDARDQVVVTVAAAYLQTVAQAARVRSAEAQRATAIALHTQAVDRLNAGTTAAIDVLRAQVQLQTREQQLIATRNDLAKQKLTLARLIGLPLSQTFTITDQHIQPPTVAAASADVLRSAYDARADYRALEAQAGSLELRRKAASARSAPAVSLSLDYGAVGISPSQASGTVGGFAAVTIPIFQGGDVRGAVAQADAALAQSRAQLEDLRGRIEQEVRSALLDSQSAVEQVRVATSMVDLAAQTLQQARDRFAAGVTDNIEVVQAQETLASASETLIVSQYSYGVAALQLARATGNTETALPDLVREQ